MTFYKELSCWAFCIYKYIIVYLYSAWFSLLQLVTPHNKPRTQPQNDRIALITGGGRGIGYETALQLLNLGMTVIILDVTFSQELHVYRKTEGKRLKFIECDLSSMEAVRKSAEEFKSMKLPLHLLINNAGIMFAPRRETEDGFESHFAINYLSHFLLTHLLLPQLMSSTSESNRCRIVNLSSCLHYPGTINFDDIHSKKCYSAEAAYCQSKLAMLLFTKVLDSRLRGGEASAKILVNAVHPAVAFSGLYDYMWWARNLSNIGRRLLKTPAMASDGVVHAASSAEVIQGGLYFDNCLSKEASAEARSIEVQERLWALSCKLCKIKIFLKVN